MLRTINSRCLKQIRNVSGFSRSSLEGVDLDGHSQVSGRNQVFGSVVNSDEGGTVIERDDILLQRVSSPFRRTDGRPIQGGNSKEARISPKTLQARTLREQIELNPLVSQVIQNNILALQIPNNLRRSASNYFVELYQNKLHRQTKTVMEVDSHIAAIFQQNYGSIFQTLAELKKRVGSRKFSPQRILDVGYGPATGIVALNDLMGKAYRPLVKDAVILGHIEMQKRAKLILSRQLNEVPELGLETDSQLEQNSNEASDDILEGDDLVGEVMTKRINITTKLRKTVPGSGQYDLIILTHQLLKNEEKFPIQVDDNLEHYLNMLAPGGYIVLIERGNPLGFETVARARQLMIRPENYPDEDGKIPRPWIRGSAKKPKTNSNLEKKAVDFGAAESLIKELNDTYGTVDEKDLEFEPELMREMVEREKEHERLNNLGYHLKILAPCPHHKKCPLQIGNPKLYQHDKDNKLKFCNFQKNVMRTKFNIELKKGKILATPWQTPTDGIGIDGLAKAGTGRPNGQNYEIINYSYMIAERSLIDEKTIGKIQDARKNNDNKFEIGSLGDNTQNTWPRIINQPKKRKGHVTFDLCGSSGQIEKWTIPKSFDKQIYHDARKAMKGDLWSLEAKTKLRGSVNSNVSNLEKLEKLRIRNLKKEAKIKDRQLDDIYQSARDKMDFDTLAKVYGHDYEKMSKK